MNKKIILSLLSFALLPYSLSLYVGITILVIPFGVRIAHTVLDIMRLIWRRPSASLRRCGDGDAEKNRLGHAFAEKVFETMRSHGYEVPLEYKVTALLNEKLDLKFAKTPNELAEQLKRFSGQLMPNGERDDLLKHVDRCDLLKTRSQRVARLFDIVARDIRIRPVVCFSTPVPMQYGAQRFPDISF